MIDSRTYDKLKEISLLWLPILTTVATGVCELFQFEYTAYVVGLLALLDTAVGMIVTYFKKVYDEVESDVTVPVIADEEPTESEE